MRRGTVPRTLLIVDDDADTRELVSSALRRRGWEVVAAANAEDAVERVRGEDVEVVVADVQLGGTSGIDLCHKLGEMAPDVPVIMVTGHGSMDTAVASIRAGAYDFITKPISVDALALAADRAARHRELSSEVRRLREAVRGRSVAGIVGDSQPIREVLGMIDQVSDSDATVLITGESGTGKELVARALHDRSPRAKSPFVAINKS